MKYLKLCLCILSMFLLFITIYLAVDTHSNRREVIPENTLKSLKLQVGNDMIQGKVDALTWNKDDHYILIIKNKEEIILKKHIKSNGKFEAVLKRPITSKDRITAQLINQREKSRSYKLRMKLMSWNVLNKPKEKVNVDDWGNVFQDSRVPDQNYRVIKAPKTGLYYLKKPVYTSAKNKLSEIRANDKSVRPIDGYKTSLLLPTKSTKLVHWRLPQGSVLHGKYLYVMYESQYHKNYGRIVRYNIEKLKSLNVWQTNHLDMLRKLEHKINNQQFGTTDDFNVLGTVTVGPEFYMGHGQAVAFNEQDNHLWMISLLRHTKKQQLMRINLNTLYPSDAHKFGFKDLKTRRLISGKHNLSIDSHGNIFIVDQIKKNTNKDLTKYNLESGDLLLYYGHVRQGKLFMKVSNTAIRQKTASFMQFLSVNPKTHDLYYLMNGVYFAIPSSDWIRDDVQSNKIKSGVYRSEGQGTREFESQVWDDKGRSYLIVNRGAEVMGEIN